MANLWLPLLLFTLAACNVANVPKPVAATGVTGTSGTTVSFTSTTLTRAESASAVYVPVAFSAPLDEATTVSYVLSGTATGVVGACGGGDYVIPTGSVTAPVGATAAVIAIQLCVDTVYEPTETLVVTLSGTNTSVGLGAKSSLTVLLTEGSPPPAVAFSSASSGSVVEGAAGTTVVPVTVSLPYASTGTVKVKVAVAGTATEGVDFAVSATQLTFAAGTTSQNILVSIYGDGTIEPNETIVLTLYDVTGGSLGTQSTHEIQITQDEVPNQVTAAIAAIAAQAETAGTVNVTVNLTGVTDHAVELRYGVDFASAIAAGQRATLTSDFMLSGFGGSTGSVWIPAGAVSVNIPITVVSDTLHEPTEGFVLSLLGGSEVAVAAGFESTEFQITDDDTAPLVGFAISAQAGVESATPGGVVVRLYHPTLANVLQPAGEDVVVGLATADGDTEGALDWTMTAASITIPAGQTEATIPFGLIQDGVDEEDETFTITLTPPGGYVAATHSTHAITIKDADPPAKVAFELTSSTASEAAPGALTVNLVLDRASERDITVGYTISGVSTSTAACGTHDITDPNSGSVTIPAGSGSPYAIPGLVLCADTYYEGDETAVLTITSATNADLGSVKTHEIAITENSLPPDVAISASVTSYDEALTPASFTVTVQPTLKPFSLTYAVTGTASVGVDHSLAASGVVNVPASTAVQNLTVNFNIKDDSMPEDAETIIMTIAAASVDASVVTPSATITINASDPLQLALGRRHTCGLLSGVVKCWGYGPVLGAGLTADYGDGAGELVSALSAVDLGAGFNPVKVVAGNDFSCALSASGTVKCWGANALGQLGQDRAGTGSLAIVGDAASEMGSSLPTVSLGAVVVDIQTSSSASHVCALLNSGRMKCWGSNAYGQLGIAFSGAACSAATPNTLCTGDDYGEVAGLSYLDFPDSGVTVVRMAVGGSHTCAQTSNNKVFCWGLNTNGALGVDSADAARYLHTVPLASAVLFNAGFSVANMTGLSANLQRTCAEFTVAGADTAVCWGEGGSGELGQGDTNDAGTVALPFASVATDMNFAGSGGTFSTITGVRMGQSHGCVRGNTGDVECWGSNASNALGSSGGPDVDDPANSTVLGPFTDVYAGDDHSCAVSGAFQYTCWGSNTNGRTGTQLDAVDAPPAVRDFQ